MSDLTGFAKSQRTHDAPIPRQHPSITGRNFLDLLSCAQQIISPRIEIFSNFSPEIVLLPLSVNTGILRLGLFKSTLSIGIPENAIIFARSMTGDFFVMLLEKNPLGQVDASASPIIMISCENMASWVIAKNIDEWIDQLEGRAHAAMREHYVKNLGEQWVKKNNKKLSDLCAFPIRSTIEGGELSPDNIAIMPFEEGVLITCCLFMENSLLKKHPGIITIN